MNASRYVGFTLEQKLEDEIEQLRGPLIDGSMKKPLTPHVTLITPPMMKSVDLLTLSHKLSVIAAQTPAIQVVLTGPHSFSGRALYIGVSSEALKSLQQEVMRALGVKTFLIEPIGKAVYSPHITLVQTSGPLGLPKEVKEPILKHQFPKRTVLRDLHLFENTGPRCYEKLESFKLADPTLADDTHS